MLWGRKPTSGRQYSDSKERPLSMIVIACLHFILTIYPKQWWAISG